MSDSGSSGAFAPITTRPKARPAVKKDDWQIVMPVPKDAPAPPARLYSGETPSMKWGYLDAHGSLIGWIYRFDNKTGKDFRPLIFCKHVKSGRSEWRWKSWPEPRPIYGLDRLAQKTDAPVLIFEGEKCADIGQNLLPDYVSITSPGGSKAALKVDWSPLAGRDVVIWPDNDQPGLAYAKKVAALALEAGATGVAIITPPKDRAQGWDIADAVVDKWTRNQANELIDRAENVTAFQPGSAPDTVSDSVANDNKKAGKKTRVKRTPKSDGALKLLDDCEFWRDVKDNAYATFTFRGRIEHSKIRDAKFKNFFNSLYYETSNGSLSPQVEEEVYRTLIARAVAKGQCYRTWSRVAFDGENIVIDLANEKGDLVHVSSAGWKIIASEEIKFLRSDTMLAMPTPEQDMADRSSIDVLRQYCNVENDSDFMLAVGWLLGAFRPSGPYTILTVTGEMGSGKSFFSELIANIVDPQDSKRVSAPKEERDLFIMAQHQHTLLFDNLSGVSRALSDSFCRISTGGSMVTRRLHSDDGLMSLKAQNPIVLNGIPDLSKQSDLADRSIPLQLKTLEGTGRMTEEDLNIALNKDLPLIYGAIFDGLAAGVRNWHTTKLESQPRMADFARWVEACSGGLSWRSGAFIEVYEANRKDAYAISFESDAVASTLKDWMDLYHPAGWEGNATALLTGMNEVATESKKKEPGWPKSASAMGTAARRVAPLMRKNGYNIKNGRRSASGRSILVVPFGLAE